MKYALAVEVKLVELPDDEPTATFQPGNGPDPLQGMVSVLTNAVGRVGAMPYTQPAGFDFRKQIPVRVAGFSALADIIRRFDELVTDIEHEKMQV